MNDIAWGWQQPEKSREERVGEFNKACGKLTYKQGSIASYLELDLFMEEVKELKTAYYDYLVDQSPENRQALAKEWADCQVTLSNIAWFFEINGDRAFSRVAENNMTKVGPDGKVTYRSDGKVLKPDGYKPPVMSGL